MSKSSATANPTAIVTASTVRFLRHCLLSVMSDLFLNLVSPLSKPEKTRHTGWEPFFVLLFPICRDRGNAFPMECVQSWIGPSDASCDYLGECLKCRVRGSDSSVQILGSQAFKGGWHLLEAEPRTYCKTIWIQTKECEVSIKDKGKCPMCESN